jgi:mannose-6-phosphate isomerase-like protein (cupin superfamily)
MKIQFTPEDSTVVYSNETYDVIDNTFLNNLTLSKTTLHIDRSTRGHSHEGQEEIYFFTDGCGMMQLGKSFSKVRTGDIIAISDGKFHKVINRCASNYDPQFCRGCPRGDLTFTTVFNGKRGT